MERQLGTGARLCVTLANAVVTCYFGDRTLVPWKK
jgi:hypothetical protein